MGYSPFFSLKWYFFTELENGHGQVGWMPRPALAGRGRELHLIGRSAGLSVDNDFFPLFQPLEVDRMW